MSELKLLAALAAGARLRRYNDQFLLMAGREDLDGADLQEIAGRLVTKELIRQRSRGPGASYFMLTPAGSRQLAAMQVDATEV